MGSNDGRQGDPLYELIRRHNRWRGMFIEPVPFLFQRLVRNYRNSDRFIFENCAISNQIQTVKFYYVSEVARSELGERLPYWFDQLGSFDKEHIIKHLDGMLEPYIVEAELPSTTIPAVLEKHAIKHLDLVHIDTEGYDFEILRQFDFSKLRPIAILFEHKHLCNEDQLGASELLKEKGYEIVQYFGDTLAILNGEVRGDQ